MVVVGTLMAVAARVALPSHMLLFGDVIDLFIAHNISLELNTSFSDGTNATSGMMTKYFVL